MTDAQTALYTAALTIGQTFGVGGDTWTYYPPPATDGISGATSRASSGTRTLYIVRERPTQYGQPFPPQPIAADRWRLIAPIGTAVVTDGIVVSGAFCFKIGPLETDQGYPTGIVDIATAPA